jgi:hypothetical protein
MALIVIIFELFVVIAKLFPNVHICVVECLRGGKGI